MIYPEPSCPHGVVVSSRVGCRFCDDNVVSLEAVKQERARALAPRCGDGCKWPLPSMAVHGLPDGIEIAIEVACPTCGAKHFSDVK